MAPRFSVVPLASPSRPPEEARAIVDRFRAPLERVGGTVSPTPEPGEPQLLLVLTDGTERRIVERFRPGEPIVLLTHSGSGSLPAALEALARVRQEGGRGRILHLRSSHDRIGWEKVLATVRDLEARRDLKAARIGLVGDASGRSVASSPDPKLVRDVWGPEVVHIPPERLCLRHRPSEGPATAALLDGASRCGPRRDQLAAAAGVHDALRDIVAEEGLDAVALRCHDLVQRLGTTGCVAVSALNDEGVVADCDGDLVAALTTLWVRHLLGTVPWGGDPTVADEEAGTLLLSHCTVPRQLVTAYALDTHPDFGVGVAVAGALPTGPVTLVRVGSRDLRALWLAEGMIVPGEEEGLADRTRTLVEMDPEGVVGLLDRPLGGRLVVVAGHHAHRLRAWWRLFVG